MPLPFSLGAPRPFTFRSLPGCEPAGTLSEIGPSGVATSIFAPSAASAIADGNLDDEIVAAALVERRRGHADDDVEIAGRPARAALLATALEPDPRPVLRARGNLHLVGLLHALSARAAARLARLLDDRPVAAAARARLREREEAVRVGRDPAPRADRADDRRRARLGPGAAAGVAGRLHVRAHRHLHARERVLEGDVDLGLEVGAAFRLRPAPRPATATGAAAEEPAEEIAEVEVLELRSPKALRTRAAVRRAEGVVGLPLLGIREDVVGALDLLEAGLVTAARVGMTLARELAIGLLDLVGRGVLGDAEGVVRIAHSLTITRVGRSTRSPRR